MCLGMSGLFFGVLSAQNVSYNISGTITYTVEDAEPIEDFTFEILSEPDGNTPGTAKVVSYNGSATSVEIPSSIGSKVESSGDSTDTSDGSSSGSSSSGSSSSSGETSYNEPIWTISSYSEFDSIMSSESAEMIMIYFGYFTLTCNDGSASEQQYTIKDFSEFCKTIWGDSYSSDTEPDATVFNKKCPMTFDCTTFECSNLTEFNTKSENFSEESSDSTTTTSTKVVFDDSTTTDTTTSVVTLGEVFFQKMYYMLNYLDYLFEFSVAGEYIPSSVLAEILSAAAEDFSTISKSINEDPDSSFPMVVSNVREEIIVAPTGGLEYTINSYEEFLTLASDEFNAGLIEAGFFYITYTDDGETKSKYIKDFFEFYMILMMKGGTSDEGMTTAINSMAPIVFNHSTFTCTVANNQSTSQMSSSSTLGQLFFKKLLLLLENGHTFTYTDSSGSKQCSMFSGMYTIIKTYANSTTALDDSLFPIQITNVSEVVIPTGGLEYTFNSYEEFVAMMLSGFSDGGLNLLPFCGFFYVSYTDGAKTVTKYIKDLTQFSTIVENKAGGTTDDATKATFTSMIPIVFNHSTFYCTVTDNQTKSESFSSYTLGQMFFKKLYLLLEYGYTFTYTDTSGSKFCSMFNEMYTTIKTYANSTTALDDSLFPIQITNVKEIVEPTSGGIEFQMASYDDYLSVFQDEVKRQLLTYGFFTLTYNDNGTETTVVIKDFSEFSDILDENLTDTNPSEEVIDALFKELDMTINHLTFECTVANNQTTSKMNSSYTLGQYFFKKLLFLLDNGYNFAYKTSSEVKYCTKDSDLYTTIKGYAESTTALSDDIFPVKVFGVGYTCSTDVVDDDSTSDDSGSSYTKGDTYLVVSIGDSVFSGKTSITSITIPNTITKIGNSVFKNCKGLETLVIPSSVTSIGNSAFFGCTGFTTFTLPDNVTVLGISMFYGCSSLTSITLPTSLQAIPDSMFYGCTSLTSFTIPTNITSIGSSVFRGCTSLVTVEFPNGVTVLGDSAFNGCSKLSSITLSSSLLAIPNSTFYGCSSLSSITIPDAVTSIGSQAFGNTGLTSLNIPKSVTSIGTSAFSNCISLSSVVWEADSTLTQINSSAFVNCTGLTSLTIPKSVTYIGTSAFNSCSKLESVVWEDNSVLTQIDFSAFENCTSLTTIVIPKSVESIGWGVLEGCSSLRELTIPFIGKSLTDSSNELCYIFGSYVNKSSVPSSLTKLELTKATKLNSYAFQDCSNLVKIILPSSLKEVGMRAFEDCSGLTSLTIPNSVESMDFGSLLYGCTSLEFLSIPFVGSSYSSTNSLGYAFSSSVPSSLKTVYVTNCQSLTTAFYNCSKIENIKIDGSNISLGYEAFEDCSNLVNLDISANISSLGDRVFYSCSKLKSLKLCGSFSSIGYQSFYNCSELEELELPDTVISIGYRAFNGCSLLKNLALPNTVTYVGDGAFGSCEQLQNIKDTYIYIKTTTNDYFYLLAVTDKTITSASLNSNCKFIGDSVFSGCSKLSSVSLPETVLQIGGYAFSNCSSLTQFAFPNNLKLIGACAFASTGLTSLTLPIGVEWIGNYVFSACSGLKSVTIPEGLTSLSGYMFNNCSGLTSVQFPSTLTCLNLGVFRYCTGLTSITIPGNVKSIEQDAFDECTNLKSIYLQDGVEKIGDYAFDACTSATTIEIPDSVTTFGVGSFRECKSITSINIPDGITELPYRVFQRCYKLSSITIPSSVKTFGAYAFDDCSKLASVKISSLESWLDSSFASSTANPLYYGDGSLYLNDTLLNNLVIPDGVTSIKRYTFPSNKFTSITIPTTVTTFEDDAFYGCSGLGSVKISSLESWLDSSFASSTANPLYYNGNLYLNDTLLNNLVIPDGVTSIKKYTFLSDKFTSITIPKTVTNIDSYAFFGCNGLSSIEIPDTVTSIGEYSFKGCSSLTSITIPSKVTNIKNSTFSECSKLTSITIPETVTWIGTYAFYNCSALTSITIPDAVRSIGIYAFAGCSALTSITIPDAVTNIANNTFDGCSSLTSIIIPKNVTKIGTYAFRNCSALTSITIPETVTSLGSASFYGCKALTSVTIPEAVTNISSQTFYGCSALTSITIPKSVSLIEYQVFSNCTSLTSIVFEDTVGWFVSTSSSATSGTDIVVTDSSSNSTNLISTYCTYYWIKKKSSSS